MKLQESHIHSVMNVLRYCNLDESLQEEPSLFKNNALEHLYKTKELDYMSSIVLRLFENTEVSMFLFEVLISNRNFTSAWRDGKIINSMVRIMWLHP